MTHYIGPANPMHGQFKATADYQASHFAWHYGNGVGTITLNRPERKNPLTSMACAPAPTSRRWWSPAPAATSARVAMCTKSSARSPA
jgi:hypothetical protein